MKYIKMFSTTIMQDDDEAMEEYLRKHPDNIELTDNKCITPFIFACIKEKIKIIKCLLSHHANIYAVTKTGSDGMGWICTNGNYELAKLLFDAGYDEKEALKHSVYHALLVNACINVNGKDGKEICKLIDLLVSHGVDINQQGRGGSTPLHHARCNIDPEIPNSCLPFIHLIELGARMDIKDNYGYTAIDIDDGIHEWKKSNAIILNILNDIKSREKKCGNNFDYNI